MGERDVKGTRGILLRSSSGGTYFVPHSDLSKYRLADEAAATVPDALESDTHGTELSPNVRKVDAYEVPLLHHTERDAAGFPMPESDNGFPMPESDEAGSFPMPESTASAGGFPMPESEDAATSFPMPERAAGEFPMPESDAASFPMPESEPPGFPMPESGASGD